MASVLHRRPEHVQQRVFRYTLSLSLYTMVCVPVHVYEIKLASLFVWLWFTTRMLLQCFASLVRTALHDGSAIV